MGPRLKIVLRCSVFAGPLLIGIAVASGVGTMSITQPATIPVPVKEKQTWDFESDEPGTIARGFSNEVGRWVVALDGKNRVLAQKAVNDDTIFNVALADKTSYRDLDLSVRMKAIEGETDRGGGLVWRAKDKDNYYVCRYNPLKGASYRVYKVVAGRRTQFQALVLPEDLEWHDLRVVMKGNRMTCYFDGKKCLEVEDATFPEAGKVGLWSKSDARSYFDDVTVAEPE
jgi:hypothetical protein